MFFDPELQLSNCFSLGWQLYMRVASVDLATARVTEDRLADVLNDSGFHHSAVSRMTKIVEPQVIGQGIANCPEPGGFVAANRCTVKLEDMPFLFANGPEHLTCNRAQRNLSSLASCCFGAADVQHTQVEIDMLPELVQDFSSSQPGVKGHQDHPAQVSGSCIEQLLLIEHAEYASFLANAMQFAESAETWGIITPELAELYEKAGYYAHYHLFDLRLAERLYRKCISICDSLQMDPKKCLSARRSLGLLLQFQGSVEEGEALLAKAVDTAETGRDAIELADSLNDIGVFYRHQHRHREAESCLTRTIAIRQKELGDQHPETIKARHDLALLYDVEGRFTEAEPLYQAAVQIFLERFGSSHIYSATVLHNYGKHWHKRNQLGSAEQFYRDAVSGFESSVGKDNPRTMVALQGLARIYEQIGNLQAAEAAFARVFATRFRMFGREHELTARAERTLCRVRQKQANVLNQ